MKRYILLFSLISLVALSTLAQKPTTETIRKRISLGVGVFNDFWQNVPADISPRKINQGSDVFLTYSFPMDKKGHLSFFAGAGLGMHNFYHQALLGVNEDGVSYFYKAPEKVNGNKITVKKSKLSLTYFDIPFGFQYKASNKLHGTLGFKVGWTINDHTKYKGSDLTGSGFLVKEKSLNLRNIQNLHYGPYATFGYKWIGVSAFYQISSVFEKDFGPELAPISIGLVFKPF